MKLKDIVNEKNDVRKYMSIDMPDEVKDELEASGDYDVDSVLQAARIYVDAYKFDEEIIPLKLNDDQKIVLEWLKSNRNSLKVPILAFYELVELAAENTNLAYHQLDSKQEIEVLAAFAQWGLGQEEA